MLKYGIWRHWSHDIQGITFLETHEKLKLPYNKINWKIFGNPNRQFFLKNSLSIVAIGQVTPPSIEFKHTSISKL